MSIEIDVVLAMPEEQFLLSLSVPEGTCAREAVTRALSAGLVGHGYVDIDPLTAPLGIFSERVDDDYVVKTGDRVEIYRPLQQDPKELRRQRAQSGSFSHQ